MTTFGGAAVSTAGEKLPDPEYLEIDRPKSGRSSGIDRCQSSPSPRNRIPTKVALDLPYVWSCVVHIFSPARSCSSSWSPPFRPASSATSAMALGAEAEADSIHKTATARSAALAIRRHCPRAAPTSSGTRTAFPQIQSRSSCTTSSARATTRATASPTSSSRPAACTRRTRARRSAERTAYASAGAFPTSKGSGESSPRTTATMTSAARRASIRSTARIPAHATSPISAVIRCPSPMGAAEVEAATSVHTRDRR